MRLISTQCTASSMQRPPPVAPSAALAAPNVILSCNVTPSYYQAIGREGVDTRLIKERCLRLQQLYQAVARESNRKRDSSIDGNVEATTIRRSSLWTVLTAMCMDSLLWPFLPRMCRCAGNNFRWYVPLAYAVRMFKCSPGMS